MRPYRGAVLAVLGLLLVRYALGQESDKPSLPASEANPAIPAAGHSLHGEAFDEGPRQAAILLPGQGEIHFPATTNQPQAQAFINQGVAQLHTFYYLESERSFRQAAKLDPECVLAYWGMAMSNVNNAKRAKSFLKEAFAKAAVTRISRREQLYLDALNAKYREGGDDKSRRHGWLQGLESIVQEFPEDADARAWLAMVTWENSNSGDPIGSRQAIDELLRSIEATAPMHPGMHHYRIHLWDGIKPALAEKSAGLYALAAPGIAHAWHMPGHTYTGLKRYDDAAYQQEGSARVDHAAMARDRIMPFEIHNYAHNNQWLATSLSHAGRPHDAIAVARNLVEQPRDPKKNNGSDGGSPQRSGRSRWSEVLVRYELWDDLIEATESGALDWSDLPIEQRERDYTLGLAYAAKGNMSKLREQIEALGQLAPKPAEEKPPAPEPEKSRRGRRGQGAGRRGGEGIDVKGQVAELEGYVLLAEGKNDEAMKHFGEASPMRAEAKARAQLRAGKPELAEETIRNTVASNENQAPPLLCQIEVLHAVGKDKEAQEADARLVGLAPRFDRDVPAFVRLSAIEQAWAASGSWRPPVHVPSELVSKRQDLTKLGPLGWCPYSAEHFTINDTEGHPRSLSDYRGRNLVVLFYLGGKCAHCLQQLQEFAKEHEALRALGADLVAISTDDLEATKALKASEDVKFSMPLLPDPELKAFKLYRCYDDFENQPLHGTFLIDADGYVRFQNIAAEPFLDAVFFKTEAERVNKMTGRAHAAGHAVAGKGCGD